MKISVFENEFNAIRTSFDGFNLLYFNGELEFDIFSSSQDIGDLNKLSNYKVAIIDIDLSIKSKLDGFQLIEEIQKLNLPDLKIIILTGHIAIKDKLKELNFPSYPVISKPINLTTIKNAFDYYGLKSTTQ